jgi:hypothetical protein
MPNLRGRQFISGCLLVLSVLEGRISKLLLFALRPAMSPRRAARDQVSHPDKQMKKDLFKS